MTTPIQLLCQKVMVYYITETETIQEVEVSEISPTSSYIDSCH